MLATEESTWEGAIEAPRTQRWFLPGRRSSPSVWRIPALLMAAGLVVTALASLTLMRHWSPDPGNASAGTRPPVPAPASPGVALGGPADVAAQMASYTPGQSSGWHSHTGLHAVLVVSGTLTIVDGECRRQTYGPGDSYVGGRELHLALNETTSVLDMVVTYMFPVGLSHTGFHVPAARPANCEEPVATLVSNHVRP